MDPLLQGQQGHGHHRDGRGDLAVSDGGDGWVVGDTVSAARAAAGKVQGRRTTIPIRHPIAVPDGEWDITLQTTWVEPAYLEPDASWSAPGGEPVVDKGTATRRMILGNRVMVEEMEGQMAGQPFTGQGLHGYDNVTGKYWATWNDSMTTGLMVSEGSCDADGACTFTGRYNDALSKQPMATRMTTRWTDPSTEVFEMYGPGPGGKEAKMMEITYRKRAP